MQKEDIVKSYFQAWLDKNIGLLENIFADDIVYSECYGPEYHGLPQVLKWFYDWNRNGTVSLFFIIHTINGCLNFIIKK